MHMATLKDRLIRWKEGRTTWQKVGDIVFWILLLLLLIPGPRKFLVTNLNRMILPIKTPGMMAEHKQVPLTEQDYLWTLQDDAGQPFSLESFRGQPVFLNFWATWCPPCVAELPEIQKAWEKHGDHVAFLLVTNQNPAAVEAFMEKYGYEFPVVYARGEPPLTFRHGAIPTTYIISPQGKIVVKKAGAVNWDSRSTDRIFESLLR
jgi:thiol-disulfide isomerase/thioredoxin